MRIIQTRPGYITMQPGTFKCDNCKEQVAKMVQHANGVVLCVSCQSTAGQDPMLVDEIAYNKRRGTGVRSSWAGD